MSTTREMIMAYYVETIDIDFVIPAENLDDAYTAMCELNAHDELKHGGLSLRGLNKDCVKPAGSTSLASSPSKYFSWLDWNYDETCLTAQEIFKELGFSTEIDEKGNLCLLAYDNKNNQEELFLKACAPYVAKGSYIIWQGEDEKMWKHEFDGKTMTVKYPKTIWVLEEHLEQQ